jgi:phospholipase C
MSPCQEENGVKENQKMRRRFATVLMLGMIAVMVPSGRAAAQQNDVPIDHIIVFYQENHTFDNLYGEFPGANGLNARRSGDAGEQDRPALPDPATATQRR